MKSFIFVVAFMLVISGSFLHVTFAQYPAASNLYKSAARHGVSSKHGTAITSFQNNSQQPSVTKIKPEIPMSLQPLTRQDIVLTYNVTNTDDTGPGSLRQAIVYANASPGIDMISFAIPASGVQTIRPASALPMITDSIIIDGTTQPGYTGKPLIEIDGSNAGTGKNGFVILAGRSIIRGLIINRFISNDIVNGMGIVLDQNGGNIIEGNYIGTDAAGEYTAGNGGSGIAIFGGSSGNLIGGTTTAKRNIISGNMMSGIQISSGSVGGNRIVNNYIGLNVTGDSARGNLGNGIYCDAPNNIIGDTVANSRNIISGNYMPGIALDPDADGTVIKGNYIGTDWGLWGDLGNSNNGIAILGASNNIIGGPSKKARNSILSSDQAGIIISGPTATGNIILGNYIGANPSNWAVTQNRVGIWILNSPGNTIGGTVDSAWNLITLNKVNGIEITGSASSGNQIMGNRIGGYYSTLSTFGNSSYGIAIDNAPNNIIGGTASFTGNMINGNLKGGIIIVGDAASGNVVKGNSIGPDLNGAKGNGVQADGIILAAPANLIGGTERFAGNTIMYNKRCGIYDSTGRKNAFLGNVIYANDSLGIDLAPRGITPNDVGDADVGANDLQNFPILDSAAIYFDSTRIRGRMSGIPGSTYTLEFFKNSLHHPSHFGQGAELFGRGTVTCDGNGKGAINITIPASVQIQQIISATATSADSSTSEFSRELCMLDSDDDGILNLWESPNDGIDWNCDGIIDLNLYDKGARKYHKDIIVEIDHMASIGDSLEPYANAIGDVETAFRSVKNKYVNNPDGNDGINLIAEIDFGSAPIPNSVWTDPPWGQFDSVKVHYFGTKEEHDDKNWQNIREAKKLVYRYCVFADQVDTDGSGGIAAGSDGDVVPDFIISLGKYSPRGGTRDQQAGTFMHELGHTLGLRHGGYDGINFKPNYYSVMNYLFQLPGKKLPRETWRLDYSPVALMTQYENQLDELRGLNPEPGDYPEVLIPYNRPNNKIALARLKPNTSVDWDGNGDSTNFAADTVDINYIYKSIGFSPSPGEQLDGYADWPRLKMNFRNNSTLGGSQSTKKILEPLPKELDPTMIEFLDSLPDYGIVKLLSSWSYNPNENIPIATDSATNLSLQIVSDGHGGAIMAWYHGEAWSSSFGMSPNSGICAQRIDSMGRLQWRNNGIMVKKGVHPSLSSTIADGAGGVIIVWGDSTTTHSIFNVYAQRIDSYGRLLWGPQGVSVTSYNSNVRIPYPAAVSDQRGGAVVVWNMANALYSQHISDSGVVLWLQDGVRVGVIEPSVYGSGVTPVIKYDTVYGAFVVWNARWPGANYSVYTQRITPSGNIQWASDGKIIFSQSGKDATSPVSVRNGDRSIIISWAQSQAYSKIYAQRINAEGQLLWGTNGIPVDTSTGNKSYPQIVSDCSGGAIIIWNDTRRNIQWYPDLYAQRIDSNGIAKWTPNGMFVTDSLDSPIFTSVSDNAGGAIVTFGTSLLENNWRDDIYVHHIDSAGITTWSGNRTRICAASFTQSEPVTVSDNAGGAVVAWLDNRRSNDVSGSQKCIYAQKVNRNGGLGDALITGVHDGHSTLPTGFELKQNYPNPFNPSTTIKFRLPVISKVTVRIYNILGQLVKELVNGIETAGEHSVVWNTRSIASGVYFYRLEAISTSAHNKAFTQVKKMVLIK